MKNDKVMAIDFTAFQNQSLRMFDTLAEMAKFTAAACGGIKITAGMGNCAGIFG